MKTLSIILSVALVLVSVGCQSVPKMTAEQRTALQSRQYQNSNLDSVFKAFKAVLLADGFMIKSQDAAGGLIVASVNKQNKVNFLGLDWNVQSGGNHDNAKVLSQTMDISVNIEQVSADLVKANAVIYQVNNYDNGSHDQEEVVDSKVYEDIFAKAQVEVNKRVQSSPVTKPKAKPKK